MGSQSPGEFRVTVEVSDSGTPRAKDSQSVTIKVALDSAQFTVLTASVVRDGQPQAWLFDRLKNQRLVLTPKTRFRYGDVEAEVVSIGERAVVFRVGKNDLELALGDSIQKLKAIATKPKAEKPAAEKPAAKSRLLISRLLKSRLLKSRLLKSRLLKSRLLKSRLLKSRLPKSRLLKSRLLKSRLLKSRLPIKTAAETPAHGKSANWETPICLGGEGVVP
ncbi:MAG: hypothetical protein CM1200mP2_43100 [Planctomycetaceae bacterium]|nr:MAG: hypothetical protein CM1200mP2_43100 [Planctomycetaceae bacterium]